MTPKGIEVVLLENEMERNQPISPKCLPEPGSVMDTVCILFHMVPSIASMTDMIAIIILIFQFRNLKLSGTKKLAKLLTSSIIGILPSCLLCSVAQTSKYCSIKKKNS